MERDRYKRSIKRNLYEVRDLLSMRNAINALVNAQPDFGNSFFRYAYMALFNDMMTHAMRILDRHRDTTSLWYLIRCNESQVHSALKAAELPKEWITDLAEKLKQVRDKTHFHIDRNDVFAPDDVWSRANITGDDLNRVFDRLWDALNRLYKTVNERDFRQFIYQGGDVKVIIEASHKAGVDI